MKRDKQPKGTNTEPKLLPSADFRRKTQEIADPPRPPPPPKKTQETAESCRNPFVPASLSLLISVVPIVTRVFLSPFLGKIVVCTSDSRGSSLFPRIVPNGFPLIQRSTPLFVAVWIVFVVFVIPVVFAKATGLPKSRQRVAISPTIYRPRKPGSPKTAAEIAGETRGAGGECWGNCCGDCQKSAVSLLLRARAVPPAVSAAVPPALPPAPRVSPQFPGSSLRSSFGESRLGGLVEGRGNRKQRDADGFSQAGFLKYRNASPPRPFPNTSPTLSLTLSSTLPQPFPNPSPTSLQPLLKPLLQPIQKANFEKHHHPPIKYLYLSIYNMSCKYLFLQNYRLRFSHVVSGKSPPLPRISGM